MMGNQGRITLQLHSELQEAARGVNHAMGRVVAFLDPA
jgi:hypothetical protein